MGSDAAIPSSPAPKDLGRKKKTNRSARLKQCKRDARREQWLSQGKGKGCKGGDDATTGQSSPPHNHACDPVDAVNVEARSRGEGGGKGRNERLSIDIPANTQWENSSEVDCPSNSLGSLSSSCGSCSRSISDADEYYEEDRQSGAGEEGGLDDWEAVADALTTSDDPQVHIKKEVDVPTVSVSEAIGNQCDPSRGILRTPPEPRLALRAWKPDDAFRPRSLPNLTKQRVHSKNMLPSYGGGNAGWLCRNFDFEPISCPICYEDLDMTDTSFLPCSCGFRLCLFCHKRILEADGRCPGCRKQYSSTMAGDLPVAGGACVQHNCLSRSRSTNARP